MTIKKYSAEWCWPCKMYKSTRQEVKVKYPEFNFVDIDVDKERDEASKEWIRSLPTTVINGNKVVWVLSVEQLIDFIETNKPT